MTATNTIGKLTPSSNPTGTEAILKTDASGKLTLAQLDISGDIGIDGSVSSNVIPQTTDTFDIGSPTAMWRKGYLSEIDAFVYAENVVSVLGGTQVISKGVGHLTAQLTASTSDTNLYTAASLAVGDYLLFRNGLTVEYMKVTAIVSLGVRYTVTRNVDSTGVNAWPVDATFVVLGKSGNGRIIFDASDSPRIQLVKQGTNYNDQTEQIRIGDLNGNWNYSAETWGIAIGEYGSGKANIIAENGNLKIRNYTTDILRFASGGNNYIDGGLQLGTSGSLRSGATAFGVGTGWWLDAVSGGRFYLGNPAGNHLSWNGSALSIVGDGSGITSIDGGNITTGTIDAARISVGDLSSIAATIGSWTINSTTLANGTNIILDAVNKAISLVSATFGAKGIQLKYNGGNPQFYVGDGGNNYLKFNSNLLSWKAANSELDTSGNLTATNVNLTGVINATSGSFTGTVNASSGSFTGTVNASSGTLGDLTVDGDVTVNTGSITAGDVVIDTDGISITGGDKTVKSIRWDYSGATYDQDMYGDTSGVGHWSRLRGPDGQVRNLTFYVEGKSGGHNYAEVVMQSDMAGSHLSLSADGGGFDITETETNLLGNLHLTSNYNQIKIGESGDTNLYRSAANVLKTDDSLVVAGGLNVNTTGAAAGQIKTSANITAGTSLSSTNGHVYFGDVDVYKVATNQLTTTAIFWRRRWAWISRRNIPLE